MTSAISLAKGAPWPAWVPAEAKVYLEHVEQGQSLRSIARRTGCHASTVLRQIRKIELRRDDPLVDEALRDLAPDPVPAQPPQPDQEDTAMTAPFRCPETPDETVLEREACRILPRLLEAGACLAVAPQMEKAIVVRELPDGRTVRGAVVDRAVAQAMALKDWIAGNGAGKVLRYRITGAGRAALKRMTMDASGSEQVMQGFADQHREFDHREMEDDTDGRRRRVRYNAAESPVTAMARRRGPDGKPFLSADLVAAGERLREDFELAQMGPRVAQNWDRFLTGGDRGGFRADRGPASGPTGARDRVAAALRDLGPGLGDIALRCCCYLEGLESTERRMGWSARSGKIVLRIALQQLKRHYDEVGGGLIG
ncbi:MAG: helix-turn-helix domain-containing protein [Rhodobacteraceae bacterium]|nr:helix-turn-helix domain-containing protein [Paracoccaceae bacterium]